VYLYREMSIEELKQYLGDISYDPDLSSYQERLFSPGNLDKTIAPYNQFYYVLFVPESRLVQITNGVEKVLGYPVNEVTFNLLYEIIHPEDRPMVIKATRIAVEYSQQNKSTKPFEYVFGIDYRVKRKDGEYIRVLRQTGVYENDNHGNMAYSFGHFTDITELKKDNKMSYFVNGPEKEKLVFPLPEWCDTGITLSNKEIEVVRHLSQGMKSQEIADKLHISRHTVDTHRRNILKKTNFHNTAELIAYAKGHGLV
jgi:DNA-binding CsgD family transcriptional regulator